MGGKHAFQPSYGWPFAPLGTWEVIRFRKNSRITFDTASAPRPAKPLTTTNEPPIGSRIVKIRKGCRGEAAEHARVIRLPLPVIAPGDHCCRYRVQSSRPDSPLPLVEVAWVL